MFVHSPSACWALKVRSGPVPGVGLVDQGLADQGLADWVGPFLQEQQALEWAVHVCEEVWDTGLATSWSAGCAKDIHSRIMCSAVYAL